MLDCMFWPGRKTKCYADKEFSGNEIKVCTVLKVTVLEYLLVLSSAIQQVFYTKIDIQLVFQTTIIPLYIYSKVIWFLNKIKLFIMPDIV